MTSNKCRIFAHMALVRILKGTNLSNTLNFIDKKAGKHNLSERDHSLIRMILMTSLRRRGDLEFILSSYLKKPKKKLKINIKAVLIIGAAQIIFMRVPNHAAVSTSVDLCKGDILYWKSLCNAILRKIAENSEILIKNIMDKNLNTPDWLWKKLISQYGPNIAKKISDSHLNEPPLDLAVKNNPEYWAKKLNGIIIAENAVRLYKSTPIKQIDSFDKGLWWVQDAAAQLPCHFLGEIAGKSVIDLCAAPGGKTAQLAAAGANVTAVEISPDRAEELKNNLLRLKLLSRVNIVVKNILDWRPNHKADAVLLDAPCSSSGTIRRHPDIPWRKTEEDIKKLSDMQKNMLLAALQMAYPNAPIIYAVCSLHKEEGEDIVEFACKNGAKLDKIKNNELTSIPEAITQEGWVKTLPYMLKSKGGIDGFFIARFTST